MSKGGLLHAVSLGAFALLGLKVVALWSGDIQTRAQEPQTAQTAPAQKPPLFGRALFGRGPDYIDPETTGSVDGAKKDGAAKPPAKPATPPEPPPGPPPTNHSGIFDGRAPASPAERALYERLGQRRGELDQRASELDTREKLLQGIEKKLESSIQDLKASEEKLTSVRRQEAEATQTIKNLVTMYEVMKPKDAARVFDRLSHDVLVPVVLQMNPRKMAEVLAAMSPEAAEKLTVALASRGQSAAAPAAPSLPPNELPALPR